MSSPDEIPAPNDKTEAESASPELENPELSPEATDLWLDAEHSEEQKRSLSTDEENRTIMRPDDEQEAVSASDEWQESIDRADSEQEAASSSDDSLEVPMARRLPKEDFDTVVMQESRSFPRSFGMMDVRKEEGEEYDMLAANGRRIPKPPNPRENAGLRGLRNIGNTCFMNSILQCLSNTEPLLDFTLGNRTFRINPNSSMKGELFVAFARLLHELWHQERTFDVDTSSLKDRIQKFCPTFIGARQHDSQELLRFLLEGLHNDLNLVHQKPTAKPIDIPDDLPDEEKCRLALERSLQYDNSQITDIFRGQLKSTLTCLACGYRSVTFDPFWDLSVSIPPPSVKGASVKLQECLALFTQQETLGGAEMPKCERCRRSQPSTKRFNIQSFPDVLVIHLKRFTRDDRGKLRTGKLKLPMVKFPLENLDLGVYADPPVSNCSYNLFAISNHYGTALSGHYVAYAKHPYSKFWHQYDDGRVSECDASDVEGVEAYLLFYQLSLASKCLMDRQSH